MASAGGARCGVWPWDMGWVQGMCLCPFNVLLPPCLVSSCWGGSAAHPAPCSGSSALPHIASSGKAQGAVQVNLHPKALCLQFLLFCTFAVLYTSISQLVAETLTSVVSEALRRAELQEVQKAAPGRATLGWQSAPY